MKLSPNWQENESSISATFEAKNFLEAVGWVNEVARLAEEHNHHPDITIHSYNKLSLTLASHDKGRVTDRDYKLATEIDKVIG